MARKKKVVETIWTRDITGHIVTTMAVFGLVVSSLITTAGVATLGVEAQVAFAQNETASQTAAAFLGDNRPVTAALLPNSSSTQPRPPMDANHQMGSTTGNNWGGNMSTSSVAMGDMHAPFCPTLVRTISRGNNDATTTGDVGKLQQFLANHFNMAASSTISGYFGSTTQSLLEKFQAEQGLPQAPTAGPLTRAAIAKLCGPGNGQSANNTANTTTTAMSSSTVGSVPPPHPMPPVNGSTATQIAPTAIGSSTVSVQIISPNGGENYHAGSNEPLTITWVASGVPQGARACVALLSAAGKHFNFPPTGESCVNVSNGSGSISGPLVLNNSYLLTAGSYTAQIFIVASGLTSTSGGILAKDSSDAAFTLDDADLGVNTSVDNNASNAASMVNAVSEIGDGYTKLFEATLASFGL